MGTRRDTLETCMWLRVAKKNQGDGHWHLDLVFPGLWENGFLLPVVGVMAALFNWGSVWWEIKPCLGVSLCCGKSQQSRGRQPGKGTRSSAERGCWSFKSDVTRVRETFPMMSKGLGKTQLGRGEREWHSRPVHSWFLWISEPLPRPAWLNICLVKCTCGHSSEECWPQSSTRWETICKLGVSSPQAQKRSKSKNSVASHV